MTQTMKHTKFTFSALIFSIIAISVYASPDATPQPEETQLAQSTDYPREIVGEVVKAKGKVLYHENNAVRAQKVKKQKQELFVYDVLRTKKSSKAFISLVDKSRIVLDENSVIQFNGVKHITAEKGVVLFDIKKQGQLKGLQITTKTAVIGIKGTKFMIDTEGDSLQLYMKEGTVNVEAVKGEFEHHKTKERSFDDYMSELTTSYSEYKKKQQEEFVEFVKSIDVSENRAISINGNKLEEITIPDRVNKQFEELENFDETNF